MPAGTKDKRCCILYPGDICIGDTKLCSNFRDAQRDREEVESVPCPPKEACQEHEPLVTVQFTEDGDGIPKSTLCLMSK